MENEDGMVVTDSLDILLVTGDAGDVVVIRDEFAHFKVVNSLRVVTDGMDALRLARRQPPFQDARRPDLILLDVDLPRIDGRAVLAELHADPHLRDIPVVLLIGWDDEAAARRFAPGAAAYATKPVDFERLTEIVRRLDGFALAVIRHP